MYHLENLSALGDKNRPAYRNAANILGVYRNAANILGVCARTLRPCRWQQPQQKQ